MSNQKVSFFKSFVTIPYMNVHIIWTESFPSTKVTRLTNKLFNYNSRMTHEEWSRPRLLCYFLHCTNQRREPGHEWELFKLYTFLYVNFIFFGVCVYITSTRDFRFLLIVMSSLNTRITRDSVHDVRNSVSHCLRKTRDQDIFRGTVYDNR